MCFINGKRQVIELKRRGQEKRARRMATRPEPTIIGNCEGWSFIVGKKPAPMTSPPHIRGTLPQCNKHFTHSLFTAGIRTTWDNLWVSCGSAVHASSSFHHMTAASADMSICVEQKPAFYPI
ncbi:MAG TPA: hypothetical protein VIP31_07970, partial [Acidovorax sp.]